MAMKCVVPAHIHFHPARISVRHRLPPFGEPLLHQPDLGGLRGGNAAAKDRDGLAGVVGFRPLGHLYGLGVVADHARHELDVGGGIGAADAVLTRLLDAGLGHLNLRRGAGSDRDEPDGEA
jgi:hypothetical protein